MTPAPDLTTAELAALISRNSRLAAGTDSRPLADLIETAERNPELADAVIASATPEALALARDGADADAIRALAGDLSGDDELAGPGSETLDEWRRRHAGGPIVGAVTLAELKANDNFTAGWYLRRGDQGQV